MKTHLPNQVSQRVAVSYEKNLLGTALNRSLKIKNQGSLIGEINQTACRQSFNATNIKRE